MRVISEAFAPGHELSFRVLETLAAERTQYQELGLYRTESHGVVMLLDGKVMVTERDEFVYHEMLAHVPLLAHGAARRVLVIGGGDLGTVREVLRHPGVEQVDLCELDGRVLELSREHFPWSAATVADPRLTLQVRDGLELLAEPAAAGRYDVILVDSSEAAAEGLMPEASALFTPRFFELLRGALAPGGVAAGQCESFFFHGPFVAAAHRLLRGAFPHVAGYMATIPTYPGGLWTFYLAAAAPPPHPPAVRQAFAAATGPALRYYTDELHTACFALPAELRRALADG